jgi:hypothetical protein
MSDLDDLHYENVVTETAYDPEIAHTISPQSDEIGP